MKKLFLCPLTLFVLTLCAGSDEKIPTASTCGESLTQSSTYQNRRETVSQLFGASYKKLTPNDQGLVDILIASVSAQAPHRHK